jgi:glycosyltransferase involved in cell wall biosynthesis
MICYYYPPLLDVGCKRSVAFSKYFKKYGWNPVVLSVKNPDKTYCILGNDKPPDGVRTEYSYSIINLYKILGKMNGLLFRLFKLLGIRLKSNFFYDIFCIPDFFWGWIPLTTIKALKLIREHHISSIYVSCPPFSAAITGILLKRLIQKPLILDFRDPFRVKEVDFLTLPKFRQQIDRWLESWFIRRADILVVTSEELRRRYMSTYPNLREKTFTVYNGVDFDLIPKDLPTTKFRKFTIIYAGLYFYGSSESDTVTFFRALAALKSKRHISKNNFQFLFYGEGKKEIANIARHQGVLDLVIANSRLPYTDILKVISRSHLQLLRKGPLHIPSKLYDGIVLNVPFLATMPDSEAARIVRSYSQSSYTLDCESSNEIAAAILDAIGKYGRNQIMDNNVAGFIERFSREHLTAKLMEIITQNIKNQS